MRGASRPPRTTRFWLEALQRRRTRIEGEAPFAAEPLEFESQAEREAAVRFFNAALRAEESGLTQAHALALKFEAVDPDLAQVLRLYGDEEGWHHKLLLEFLPLVGGSVRPMGKVTRTFYRLYGRAKNIDTILLTNLMFETIGATTYRLALGTVKQPKAQLMLRILAQDEAFHVPLNIHFLREAVARGGGPGRRLKWVFLALYLSLGLLPWASRPKARAFDRISATALSLAYLEALTKVFDGEPGLGLRAPGWPSRLLRRLAPNPSTKVSLAAIDLHPTELDAEGP
jgi:hypothetical protein